MTAAIALSMAPARRCHRRGVSATAAALLARGDVAYLHARSATNNCYQFRIERV
ncbi:DUF1203 domain-containing protein [Sneathiella sp.]|uniref:DUF1203 domain-containing protein n=1 Tax=Sneathiella sp. TaxID=1964365 RepID=UPI003FA6FBFE